MPRVIANEDDEEINETILATKPKLKRSVAVEEPPKPKKERTPAQIAALEKGRKIAKEKADARRAAKNPPVEKSSDYQEPELGEESDETPIKKRTSRATPRQADDGNGWKAFAEYMVREREYKIKKETRKPEPEPVNKILNHDLKKEKPEPPKTIKVTPPQKTEQPPKKTIVFGNRR